MSRDGANAVRFILQSLPFQPERTFHRTPLPDHLPRDDVGLDIDDMTRACCGVELRTQQEQRSRILASRIHPFGTPTMRPAPPSLDRVDHQMNAVASALTKR
jgi:hypothetical protein